MKKIYVFIATFFGFMLFAQVTNAAVSASSVPTDSDNTESLSLSDCRLPIIIIDDENYPSQPKKNAKKAAPSVKKLSERPIINDTLLNQTARMINYQLLEGEKYIQNT